MNAVLSNASIDPSDMHAHHFHDWLMMQARLLREGKVGEADLVHIAQELEEMGNEIESALVSYFRQTLVHLCKMRYASHIEPSNHWRAEISNFRSEIDERAINRFTNPDKIEDMFKRAWKGARKNLKVVMSADEYQQVPLDCSFTLLQTRDADYFPDPLVLAGKGQHRMDLPR